MRLAGALWWFWWLRGYRAKGQAALERLLAAPADVPRPVRAKALLAAGALGVGGAAPATSAALLAESLTLYRELEDQTGVALVLFSLGYMAAFQGDWAAARRSLGDALERFRSQNHRWGVGGALCGLGFVALYTGDLDEAHTRFAELLAVNREAGDPQGIATPLFGLATIALVRGDATAAMAFAHEGLGLTRETGERGQVPPRLEILAAAVGASGDAARAARLFGVASSPREIVGLPLPAMAPPGYEQRVAAVRSALGESAFAAAWATGRALKLDDVLAEAIAAAPAQTSSTSANHPAPAQPGGLTPRELMVLRLLAEGRSEIGDPPRRCSSVGAPPPRTSCTSSESLAPTPAPRPVRTPCASAWPKRRAGSLEFESSQEQPKNRVNDG